MVTWTKQAFDSVGVTEYPAGPALPELQIAVQPRQSSGGADDPYTPFKGISAVRSAGKDQYGNAQGRQYDLARDGAFEGLQIAVLHLYAYFDFGPPKAALAEKGFSVQLCIGDPPSARELAKILEDSCQLWIISDCAQKLGSDHLAVIKSFFESGRGVYIWGDNAPYYADANYVAAGLFGGKMTGDVRGGQMVGVCAGGSGPGIIPNHPLCTGLEHLYEGITIATVEEHPDLQPIVFGSAGNVVVAAYDTGDNRALLDGGFTRLSNSWDLAGTGRYVKNAAAWLTNYERFGRALLKK